MFLFEFISFFDAIFPFLFLSYLVACIVYLIPYSLHCLEQVSIECRKTKTKTKVITLTNQKGQRQSSKPIKTRRNYTWPTQSAGNVQAQAMIGFGFTSIG